jgi:hypothetical protein
MVSASSFSSPSKVAQASSSSADTTSSSAAPSTPVKANAAVKKIFTPSTVLTPMQYHDVHSDYFKDTPPQGAKNGKDIRKFQKALARKALHTVMDGSKAKRHTDQIRKRKTPSNEHGQFVVQENDTDYVYGVHEQGKNKRLYPVETANGSPSVKTYTGSHLYDLRSRHKQAKMDPTATKKLTFSEFLKAQPDSAIN